MAALKKLILTPYFGPFPEWMASFEPPVGYDWLLDTDLEAFKKRVKEKLGIEYPGVYGSGKVWDYRCALGLLYEKEIRGYDYWGHCDFDMVFGDMNNFYPDSLITDYDLISGHNTYVNGCFSLYRNCKEINKLFFSCPNWVSNMTDEKASGWVEEEYSRQLEKSGLKYIYTFFQGNPWNKKPLLIKNGDSLFQDINGTWKEVAFFHFRHSKKWPL